MSLLSRVAASLATLDKLNPSQLLREQSWVEKFYKSSCTHSGKRDRQRMCSLTCPAPAVGRWTSASCWRQQILGLRSAPQYRDDEGPHVGRYSLAHPPALPPIFKAHHQALEANVLMRIIIIITCTYIYIKPPDPREVSLDCPRKKTFSLCGQWLGTHGPRSGTNYTGSRAQCRGFFNSLGLEPQQWNYLRRLECLWGTISHAAFGLGQGG